jgi:hypothetical protein
MSRVTHISNHMHLQVVLGGLGWSWVVLGVNLRRSVDLYFFEIPGVSDFVILGFLDYPAKTTQDHPRPPKTTQDHPRPPKTTREKTTNIAQTNGIHIGNNH